VKTGVLRAPLTKGLAMRSANHLAALGGRAAAVRVLAERDERETKSQMRGKP
jgi:hypothetical protein